MTLVLRREEIENTLRIFCRFDGGHFSGLND